MGWTGYGIYDGDGTQISHIDFLKWAGYKEKYNGEIYDLFLKKNKTSLDKETRQLINKNFEKILKKMPKPIRSEISNQVYFKDYHDCLDWQMLLSLFLDNGMKPPKPVKELGIIATEFLLYDHANGFDDVSLRRANLKRFLNKAKKS